MQHPIAVPTAPTAVGRAPKRAASRRRQLVRLQRHQRARGPRRGAAARGSRRPAPRHRSLLVLSAQTPSGADARSAARYARRSLDADAPRPRPTSPRPPRSAARISAERLAVRGRRRAPDAQRQAGCVRARRAAPAWCARACAGRYRAGDRVPVHRPGRAVRRHGARPVRDAARVPQRARATARAVARGRAANGRCSTVMFGEATTRRCSTTPPTRSRRCSRSSTRLRSCGAPGASSRPR